MVNKKETTRRVRRVTVKYRFHRNSPLEVVFDTVKEAKVFFYGYVVCTEGITAGEILLDKFSSVE